MSPGNHSPYELIFHSSLDAIVCSDETGLITQWNPAAEQMFGHSVSEAVGQPLTILIPADDRQRHTTGFDHLINTGKAHLSGKTVEVNALRKDRTTLPVE